MYLVLTLGLNTGPWAFEEGGGGETIKTVDNAIKVDSVSISGRQAESTSFVSSDEGKHGRASSAMPTTGCFSERK